MISKSLKANYPKITFRKNKSQTKALACDLIIFAEFVDLIRERIT